jgi:hypothetical protein
MGVINGRKQWEKKPEEPARQISQNLSAIGNPKGFTMQARNLAKFCALW